MRTLRFALPALLLQLAACDPPPAVPTAEPRQKRYDGRIEGSLVVQSTARGNLVVLLYDATRPPPPAGTGRPVSFAVVPGDKVFGAALNEDPARRTKGPFTAPYAIDLVPPGRYLVAGFIDANGCLPAPTAGCRGSDWVPWYGITGEPNFGDVRGAAADPDTRAMRVVEVPAEPGPGQTLTGVNVAFVDSNTTSVLTDRPVFKVTPLDGRATWTVGPTTATPKLLALAPTAISAPPVVQTHLPVAPPRFWLRLADDLPPFGVPDDTDGNGVPDVYPKVLVRKLTDRLAGDAAANDSLDRTPVTDENDLNRDGVLDAEVDAEGKPNPKLVTYELATGQTDSLDGVAQRVVLAAGLVLTDQMPRFCTGTFTAPGTCSGAWNFTPLPLEAGAPLVVGIQPRALDIANQAKPAVLKSVPVGAYSVTLLQFTGQTWRVPNELTPAFAERVGLPSLEEQGFRLEVVAP
jgi:hypothetical protein